MSKAKETSETSDQTNLTRLRHYQQILAEFSRIVAESSDVDSLLRLTAVQAARGIGIKHSKVMRYEREKGYLLIVSGVGWRSGVVGHVTLGSDPASVAGQTLQTRQPLVIDDLEAEKEMRIAPVLRQHGIISVLNVPIAVDGVVWGVLEVDSDTPRHFGSDDATLLLTMGNILGLALQSRQALERSAQDAHVTASALANHKVLIRELEHRFKNDFQLIQAMLALQGRRQPDPSLKRDLQNVMDRVAAIGTAHDQLSSSDIHGTVELSDYLRALCGNFSLRREGIEVEADVVSARVPHERAVPLGLVVNELVTSALKHAYPDEAFGKIRVTFTLKEYGEGFLCVQDDGVGMGPPREGSSGTDLLSRLVRQIGGAIEKMEQEKGAGFCLKFPLGN